MQFQQLERKASKLTGILECLEDSALDVAFKLLRIICKNRHYSSDTPLIVIIIVAVQSVLFVNTERSSNTRRRILVHGQPERSTAQQIDHRRPAQRARRARNHRLRPASEPTTYTHTPPPHLLCISTILQTSVALERIVFGTFSILQQAYLTFSRSL